MDDSLVFDRYYNLSLRFLSYRPRSEKEVFDYLREKQKRKSQLTEQIIAQIMERLTELKFIDDSEFTKFWLGHRKKGFKVLRMELLQKGVSKDTIEQIASKFNIEDKESFLMEKLIEKKQKSLLKYPRDKARVKMIAFLLRRGFNYDAIKKALSS